MTMMMIILTVLYKTISWVPVSAECSLLSPSQAMSLRLARLLLFYCRVVYRLGWVGLRFFSLWWVGSTIAKVLKF